LIFAIFGVPIGQAIFKTTEITPLLPAIKLPTLVIWGEDDEFQLVKYAERLVSDIPNARLVRVKDARHFVMLDYPVKVSGYISKFLKN
jgi:pimeloyl-ACP methyl ester carboxylesterase